MSNTRARTTIAAIFIAFSTLIPTESKACACGCGVFDVSTSAMLPTQEKRMVFIEYDFMNQDRNRLHSSSSASAINYDKDIKSNFFTAGVQTMFSRSWGAEIAVTYAQRHFTTTNEDTGDIHSFDYSALGDVRLKGIYSGFSGDMSSGITFGVKLPAGDYQQAGFDRDTAIGSGSTDILVGAYHTGKFTGNWNWFANAELDHPVLIRADYRPGSEANAVMGTYYNGWAIGSVKIAPVAQIVSSYRLHDSGLAANPQNSGYERILLAPGLEADIKGLRIYGDVGIPVYQYVRGNQLTAGALFKLNLSRSF